MGWIFGGEMCYNPKNRMMLPKKGGETKRRINRRMTMNITVYLGSCEGNDPAMKTAVAELGRWIGESGNRLVYGGSKTGLMGLLADSVLSAGGEVTGVELEMFMEAGYQHTGLTEMIVKPDFPQRKAEMIRRGDVFIAFPGGTGTLEEISEIMSLAALKLTKAPCVLYNLNGYYDHLRLQLRHMVDMGLSAPERLENIHFAASLQEIKDIAASAE